MAAPVERMKRLRQRKDDTTIDIADPGRLPTAPVIPVIPTRRRSHRRRDQGAPATNITAIIIGITTTIIATTDLPPDSDAYILFVVNVYYMSRKRWQIHQFSHYRCHERLIE
jgi:hypothetical protein